MLVTSLVFVFLLSCIFVGRHEYFRRQDYQNLLEEKQWQGEKLAKQKFDLGRFSSQLEQYEQYVANLRDKTKRELTQCRKMDPPSSPLELDWRLIGSGVFLIIGWSAALIVLRRAFAKGGAKPAAPSSEAEEVQTPKLYHDLPEPATNDCPALPQSAAASSPPLPARSVTRFSRANKPK